MKSTSMILLTGLILLTGCTSELEQARTECYSEQASIAEISNCLDGIPEHEFPHPDLDYYMYLYVENARVLAEAQRKGRITEAEAHVSLEQDYRELMEKQP